MNYQKLSHEIYKMYNTFLIDFRDVSQAFELAKFCVKEFPIFRDMIEEDMEDYI